MTRTTRGYLAFGFVIVLTRCAAQGSRNTLVNADLTAAAPATSPPAEKHQGEGESYEVKQQRRTDASVWWSAQNWLGVPPGGSVPRATQETALREYQRISEYAGIDVPRETKLVVVHARTDAYLGWAIGVDLTGVSVSAVGNRQGTVMLDCSEVVLVDATTGQEKNRKINCPGVLDSWFASPKSASTTP